MAPVNLSDILNVLPAEWLATPNLGTAFLLGLSAGGRIGRAVEVPAATLLASLTDPPIPKDVPDAMAVEIVRVLKSGMDGDVWGT